MVISAEFSQIIWGTFDRMQNFKSMFINWISLMFSGKKWNVSYLWLSLWPLLIFKCCTICFQVLFIFMFTWCNSITFYNTQSLSSLRIRILLKCHFYMIMNGIFHNQIYFRSISLKPEIFGRMLIWRIGAFSLCHFICKVEIDWISK